MVMDADPSVPVCQVPSGSTYSQYTLISVLSPSKAQADGKEHVSVFLSLDMDMLSWLLLVHALTVASPLNVRVNSSPIVTSAGPEMEYSSSSERAMELMRLSESADSSSAFSSASSASVMDLVSPVVLLELSAASSVSSLREEPERMSAAGMV